MKKTITSAVLTVAGAAVIWFMGWVGLLITGGIYKLINM